MEELVLNIIVYAMPLYILAFILYLIRGVRGPTVFDSVISIDAMCYDIAAFMVILSIYLSSYLMLGIAVLMALWAYILDIVISRYFEDITSVQVE